MGELSKFCTQYCKLWKYIGYKLGLEDVVLDMIQGDHSTQRDCFMATLQKWLEQDTRPTWNTLELAITNARREEQGSEPLKESMLENWHLCIYSCQWFYYLFIVPVQKVENKDKDQTKEITKSEIISLNVTRFVKTCIVHTSYFFINFEISNLYIKGI